MSKEQGKATDEAAAGGTEQTTSDPKDAIIEELTQQIEQQQRTIETLRPFEKTAKKAKSYEAEIKSLVDAGKGSLADNVQASLEGLPLVNQLRLVRALSGTIVQESGPEPIEVPKADPAPAPTAPPPSVAPPSPHTPSITGEYEREKQALIQAGHWNSAQAFALAKKYRRDQQS